MTRQPTRNNPPFAEILDPWAEFLRDRDYNITSQGGEDGLIAALFERIGTRNGWCFEVGAADGSYLSNTWALRQNGWMAVLIEADDQQFAEICRINKLERNCYPVHKRIGPHDLDAILGSWGKDVPHDLDLGVIDIDGEDVRIWGGLKRFRPRVILIEYNTTGRDGDINPGIWQAGPDTVIAMGHKKGYRPLVKTACNLLFVDEADA